MNTSSQPRTDTFQTPEYTEILENIQTLKTEVAAFGQTNPGTQHNKLLKRCDALEDSEIRAILREADLRDTLRRLAAEAREMDG